MTNTEISRRLALAIGYRPEDVKVSNASVWVLRSPTRGHPRNWWRFAHKEWDTIGPIAARYKLFPQWLIESKRWSVYWGNGWKVHACPATCIALAVIEASERGLLS